MSYVTGRLLNVPNVNDIQKQINELNDKATELENTKQDKLVSGENIKTVDGNSIVGQGNVPFKTLNGEQLSGEGNIDIHNEPLTIKTGLSSGDVVYDGTEAVKVEISPITVTTEPVEYTYDSQLKFYREPTENEEQLGSIYYIGADQPITTTVQNTEEKIHDPIAAEDITKVFTAPFVDIFTEQEIEVSSKAFTYVKEYESESEEPQEDDGGEDTGDNNSEGPIKAAAKPVLDTYLQFGNGNGASGWIKLRLNKKQAYLWIKAKMFNAADYPGSIFVADDLSKLTGIDFSASEIADKLVFNYTETLVDSADEWQVIKVPVQSDSQIVYITNGRNFGTPGGPSTTYDYKRDEDGHIIWERDPETGEIIGGQIDRHNPLYGGRILIKEIGIQYEEELEAKTLFTADQFADYKATADYRFTNIEAVNEAQSSYLDEIDTHLNNVEEEFTEKFNNLGDVQIYTVDELPEQVHIDDEHKIYKCNGHYYTVVFSPEGSNDELFEFAGNSHTFDNNITSVASLVNSFANIYDDSGDTTLQYYFWIPDDSITQANKLFGSSEGSFGEYLGEQYLRFGARNYGGKLILDYKDNGDSRALTNITLSILPWINIATETDPDTGEIVKYIGSLSNSAIKIYRASEDNLIGAVLLEGATFEPHEYEYSQEGFDSLIADNKTDYTFNVQLMPGDRIIIKSDNNIGEDTGLDYRFFILGLDLYLTDTEVSFKEPFVTTDTDQEILGIKTFNSATFFRGAITGYSDNLELVNGSGDDTNITLTDSSININGIADFTSNAIFEEDVFVRKGLVDQANNRIELKDISLANNLENGDGDGSLIQANVPLTGLSWSSSDTSVATVDEFGNVTAGEEGIATITAMDLETGERAECDVIVAERPVFGLRSSNLSGYDLVTDLSDIPESTDLYLVIYDGENYLGITGWNGTKDATASTNTAEWHAYHKNSSNNLYDATIDSSTELKYIKRATSSNEFIYVAEGDMAGTFDIDTENGNLLRNTYDSTIKYIGKNGSSYRFYILNNNYPKANVYIKHVEPEPVHVEDVYLDENNLDLFIGQTHQLIASVSPNDADNKTIIWSSSDSTIATVDQDGNIEAIGEGTCTIYATAEDDTNNAQDTCEVIVSAPSGEAIVLNTNLLKLTTGSSSKLVAKYKVVNSAIGDLAIAFGQGNAASGNLSFVQGDHLVANEDNQVIFGSYNAQTDAKFVIAAGDENERFNALEVTAEGKVIAGVQTDDSDDDEVLTTKSYVDAKTGGSGSITIGNTTITEAQLIKVLALLDTLEAKDSE